jgi:alpha-tubulin suppressor-like RCC1 family protein
VKLALAVLGAAMCAALAGCSLDANYDGTTFACGAGATCPTGYACVADRCVPAAPPPPTCAIAVGTGNDHACAIRGDGTAWCWGQNSSGQLGDGTTTDRASPVAVVATGLPKLTAIAGGQAHTCAIGADKTVWCWGANESGELGNGKTSDNHTPVPVTGLDHVTSIITGYRHSCALDSAGTVKCWGDSFYGELGNGTSGDASAASTPVTVQLTGGATATMIAGANAQTCAVETTGAVECWGANDLGQLGDGAADGDPAPLPVKMQLPTDNAIAVAVGAQFACALTKDGAVYCAGHNDVDQLGPKPVGTDPNADDSTPTPRLVPLDLTATAIFAGDRFACAIDAHAKAWCWGATDNFELPDGGDGSPRAYPVEIDYPDIKFASAGTRFMCVQSSDGLRCGGYNGFGQLGDGVRTTEPVPLAVDGLGPVAAIAAGASFTCATLADQTAMCWGENDRGQLGDGTFAGKTHPVAVTGLHDVIQLASGHQHSCALLADHTVECWGDNDSGELGDGTPVSRSAPRPVLDGAAPLANVKEIAVGIAHTCALLNDGTMKCWGSNSDGQLGVAQLDQDLRSPVNVALSTAPAGPTGVSHIVAGDAFTCAVDGAGQPWCWGKNDVGKLGGGVDVVRTATPTQVANLKDVVIDQASSFTGFTCAHAASNGVWCWGYNSDGELGNGGFSFFVDKPAKVKGLAATKIVAGELHACALTVDRGVMCWGGDYLGQVGQAVYNGFPSNTSVAGLANVTDLAAGSGHTCAVLDGGKLMCWGDDRDGELGNGVSFDRTPVAPLLACPK